jgi:hypothetical protein
MTDILCLTAHVDRRGSFRLKNEAATASMSLPVPVRSEEQQKCDLRPQQQNSSSTTRFRGVFKRISYDLSSAAAPAPGLTGQDQQMCEFCISSTAGDGGHRTYYLRVQSEAECADWVQYLTHAAHVAKRRFDSTNSFLRFKSRCAMIYQHDLSQGLVALLIGASFITNVLEVQLNPAEKDPELTRIFTDIDIIFTILFVLELSLNLFVNWLRPFFQESWNVFDFVVVSVSVISLFTSSIGSATAMRSIRLMRAFRVLRLFGRLQELRSIVEALGRSLVPVASAFTIVTLVLCVYAIVGVQLFQEQQQDSFGNFFKALYTMFAASTMDGWQELVAIPFISAEEAADSETVPTGHLGLILFFVSFFLIVAWTLLPVVIAVLLDNFSGAIADDRKAQEREKLKISGLDRTEHILDPLLELLCQHESQDDLKQRVENLFYGLVGDVDGDKLSAHSFITNLARKRFSNSSRIRLSQEDFHALTRRGLLCGRDGCLSLENFQNIMQLELKAYVERRVAKEFLATSFHGPESVAALLLAVKDMTTRLAALESSIDEIRVHGGMKSKVLPQGTLLRRSISESNRRTASVRLNHACDTSLEQPPSAISGLQIQTSSRDTETDGVERPGKSSQDRPQVRHTVRGASSAQETRHGTDGADVTIDLGFESPRGYDVLNAMLHKDAGAQSQELRARRLPSPTLSPTLSPRPAPPSPSPGPMSANNAPQRKGREAGSDTWDKLRTKQLTYRQMKQKAQATQAPQ